MAANPEIMGDPLVASEPAPARREAAPNTARWVRPVCWAALLTVGAIETWQVRHYIFSDGVSYLDIAGYYLRGDWAHAVNDYWSPLYSWLLALLFRVFRPPAYWQVTTLHALNFAAFIAAVAAFELVLSELLKFRRGMQSRNALLSEQTVRIAGYASVMWAGLHFVSTGYCSPDMLAMGVVFLSAYYLLRVVNGSARNGTYAAFGGVMGVGYLARAAFLPFIAVCVAVMAAHLWLRGKPFIRPVALTSAAAFALIAPWVAAMSVTHGGFTLGSTGRLNYAWEVCGAARTNHWQGEPGDIGVPVHPTRKVFDHPAAYTFVADVPGVYPPWYEPSYWYAGVKPHLKIRPQLEVFFADLKYLAFLLAASPILLPCLALILMGGLARGLWVRRLFAHWFLLLPMAASMALYCLVFLDRRYIAGCLAVVWICVLASAAVPQRVVSHANRLTQILAVLFCGAFVANWLGQSAVDAFGDLIHGREAVWNLQWMLAQRFRQLGLKEGDRVAYIGQPIDADWARLTGVKIVAEVPVIWLRFQQLNRSVYADEREVRAYWSADDQTRARVLEAFRDAGASMVVADSAPAAAAFDGWRRVLPPDAAHLPTERHGGQFDSLVGTSYLRLTDANHAPASSR